MLNVFPIPFFMTFYILIICFFLLASVDDWPNCNLRHSCTSVHVLQIINTEGMDISKLRKIVTRHSFGE